MLKSTELAVAVLVVATAFTIAGCRSGGNRPAQAAFGSPQSFSQGSGTSAPAYDGGSGSRPASTADYGGGGSDSRSYGGGGSGGR